MASKDPAIHPPYRAARDRRLMAETQVPVLAATTLLDLFDATNPGMQETRQFIAALEALTGNLAATEEALLDATDRIEQARMLCREQVTFWRRTRRWDWIEVQPTTRAFYGPLSGS